MSALETLEAEESCLNRIDEQVVEKRLALAQMMQELAALEADRNAVAAHIQTLRREWQTEWQMGAAHTATSPQNALFHSPHPSHPENADTVAALDAALLAEQEKVRFLERDAEGSRALKGLLLQKRCYQCHHQMVCACEGFPALGVELSDARRFDVDGVWVVSVVENGPAFCSGILPNDVIYEWDGVPVSTRVDMRAALSQATPMQDVCLSLSRDNGSPDAAPIPMRIKVTLGSSRTKPQGVRPIKLKSPIKSRQPNTALMML